MRHVAVVLAFSSALVCSQAQAEASRDILMGAAYGTRDKATALTKVGQALAVADAEIKRDPRDQSARLQRALAISYRGSLTRSRSDVLAARKDFEAIVAANPRDAEAQLALAGWHLGAIIELGPMMARTVLGARVAAGNAALARSLALGGDHAAIPAVACLHQIQINPSDVAGARRLAEAATRAGAGTSFDRLMQRQAAALLPALVKGDGKRAAALAKLLMPFGRVPK